MREQSLPPEACPYMPEDLHRAALPPPIQPRRPKCRREQREEEKLTLFLFFAGSWVALFSATFRPTSAVPSLSKTTAEKPLLPSPTSGLSPTPWKPDVAEKSPEAQSGKEERRKSLLCTDFEPTISPAPTNSGRTTMSRSFPSSPATRSNQASPPCVPPIAGKIGKSSDIPLMPELSRDLIAAAARPPDQHSLTSLSGPSFRGDFQTLSLP